MTRIDKEKCREIIDDFATEIYQQRTTGAKPQKAVINFRNERKNGIERDIYEVPLELLRFRKDNGRIRADVISYEKEYGILDEKSKEAQEEIGKMLDKNDPEKNEELERSIKHDGQREPAIITCDGFLINGNRRKMILDKIKSKYMRVIILPGKNDSGGPPTKLEIEEIENRYQHQSEGKAEYTKFNTALSIQRKMDMGMSLEEQLRDDPIYAGLPDKEFKKACKNILEEYIRPLECIDRYLEKLGREGLYNTIAAGTGDREGRWQAFLDYYNRVYKNITDPKQRLILGINESEVGKIEDIAQKIIRKREFSGLGKAHQIMRDIPKWITNPDAKKELYEIAKVPHDLEDKDSETKVEDESTKDKVWANKYQTIIYKQLKRARDTYEQARSKETPIELLESALKKMIHENLLIDTIDRSDIPKARSLLKAIKEKSSSLEAELYHFEKNL